jgi:hypothetical protein
MNSMLELRPVEPRTVLSVLRAKALSGASPEGAIAPVIAALVASDQMSGQTFDPLSEFAMSVCLGIYENSLREIPNAIGIDSFATIA